MFNLETYGADIIREFLVSMRDGLVSYMDANDRNASGRSRESLQVVNVTGSTGQLIGAQYIQYVFKGRGAGKLPPVDKIVDWCNARGIPRGVAWYIAKNIAASGTLLWQQKRNIFDEIITPEEVDRFIDSIAVLYTTKLNTDINSLLYTRQ